MFCRVAGKGRKKGVSCGYCVLCTAGDGCSDHGGVLTPVVVAVVVRFTHPRGHRLQLFTQTVLPSWSAAVITFC